MAGQLPSRPWFRLGSITRPPPPPAAAAPPEPRPTTVRPLVIRPSARTEPQSAADKSPPTPNPKLPTHAPPSVAALPRSNATTTSLPSSPAAAKLSNSTSPSSSSPPKKANSPPASTFTKPVLPSPTADFKNRAGSANPSLPPKSTPLPAFDPKPRSSLPPSPANPESPINTKFVGRAPNPAPSPTMSDAKPTQPSPYQSPKPKPTASPPSPLVLPPSKVQSIGEPKESVIPQEVERKAVIVKKIAGNPSQSDRFSSYHAHNSSTEHNGKHGLHKDGRRKVSGFDQETNSSVVTMAGENRGALMEVILSDKNNTHQMLRKNDDGEKTEGNLNNPKQKSQQTKRSHNSLPMKAFFNSNVQGINNSILLDSSFTHNDPGIHLVLLTKPPSSIDEEGEEQN